jgi:hypothetical protein
MKHGTRTENGDAIFFEKGLVCYGKKLTFGIYQIDLIYHKAIPPICFYRNKRKPLIKNLYLLNALWLPCLPIIYALIGILASFVFLTEFTWPYVFLNNHRLTSIERISAFITFFFAGVGLITVLRWVF